MDVELRQRQHDVLLHLVLPNFDISNAYCTLQICNQSLFSNLLSLDLHLDLHFYLFHFQKLWKQQNCDKVESNLCLPFSWRRRKCISHMIVISTGNVEIRSTNFA